MSQVPSLSDLRSSIEAAPDEEPREVEYSLTKSSAEQRYTAGVMYVPGARDSDNEYVEAEELERSARAFFKSGKREIRDTHTSKTIGELVGLMTLPQPTTWDLPIPGEEKIRKVKLPAGTVIAGTVWSEEAWPLVKSGKLRGYSLGGRAVKVRDAATDDGLPTMKSIVEDEVTKSPGKVPLTNKPDKTNWVEQAGGLDPYVRRIAEHLKGQGKSDGNAIQIAWGVVRNWCEGKGGVSAVTKAKACTAVANMERKRAEATNKSEEGALNIDELFGISEVLPDIEVDDGADR